MRHTIIIAEAGVNHNGSLEIAKRLVDAAAEAGVDYVKFQTFKTKNLVSESAKLAEYQAKSISDASQYAMLKKLELSEAYHMELIDYCKKKNVKFLSTPFDSDSVDFLNSLHLDFWKIPSGEIANYPYLRQIARYGGKVIMSTGMCSLADIQSAIDVLLKFGIRKEDVSLLHCNTEYPTPMQDVNLSAMAELRHRFGVSVGYSDHTKGIEVPIAAVAMGATIIEKHFTIDRNLPGPDHKASLVPSELKAMVEAIRNIEKAIGNGHKDVTESERKNVCTARKSIVASRPIKKGEKFSDDNITTKRPATGMSPMMWESVIGKTAARDFAQDQPIEI